jgi:hypothetical protein
MKCDNHKVHTTQPIYEIGTETVADVIPGNGICQNEASVFHKIYDFGGNLVNLTAHCSYCASNIMFMGTEISEEEYHQLGIAFKIMQS